ncbi:MAG: prolipoprotein diacylglyceryl transferase [Candidatus Omnitrophota bacterium]
MHPIICKIGFLNIYSYGLALAVAFMLGSLLASRQAARVHAVPETVFNLCFLIFVAGIIGARLFYVSYHLFYYLKNPLEIIMLQQGGLSWFGGLMLGAGSGFFYLKKKKLPIGKTIDLLAPYLALGQAIGRIGCFLNGCCYGRVSHFGIYFPVHDAVLIPTQLYSSILLLFIFMLLRFLRERPHRDGQIFLLYLLFYCIGRFFIEFFRADNPALFWGLTIFHLMSIAGITVAVTGIILLTRTRRK